MLAYGCDLLSWCDVPARFPVRIFTETEVVSQISLLCRKPNSVRTWKMSVANGAEDSADFDSSPITRREGVVGGVGVTPIVLLFPYLLRLAAFHFAQRARCAAAIRLRADADMVLRFLPSV